MRVEPAPDRLSESQRRLADAGADGGAICLTGPPGSGKTAALAERAVRARTRGPVAVVCSHDASRMAFQRALGDGRSRDVTVDTLDGHLARWMRAEFASSGVHSGLRVGGPDDSRALVRDAARGLLDLSWPIVQAPDFSLDLPFLARPDAFLDEASALFRHLRRLSISAQEFEAGCTSGLSEFYGDDVERALARCADGSLSAGASKRGRSALSAGAQQLAVQKRAERDVARLLIQLYARYCDAARGARRLCVEDAIDAGMRWLRADAPARKRLASSLGAMIVDDAEDAEPAAAELVALLNGEGLNDIAMGGWAESAIDAFGGRRNLIPADPARRVELPVPPLPTRGQSAERLADEPAEADRVAASIGELCAAGAAPRDIAVLARDADAAGVYATLLAQRGVPIEAPSRAWTSPAAIGDLLALACVVDDPYDQAHLLRVLASPVVGLNDLSLWTLCRDPADTAQLALPLDPAQAPVATGMNPGPRTLADNVLSGRADSALGADARASLAAFRSGLARWRAASESMTPAASLAYLADAAGFRAAFARAPLHERSRLEDDLLRLVAGIAAQADALGAGLGAAARRVESAPIARRTNPDGSGVSCHTIIDAKGLRWPHVFVAGVAFERFPRIYVSRPLAFSKKYGLIVRENVAGGASQTAKYAWYYTKFGAKNRYLEEEARVLGYAMRRANCSAMASGFGKPPRWAAGQDLLATFGV